VVVGIVLLFVHLWLGGDTLCIHRHGDCRTIGNEDMSPQEKALELFSKYSLVNAEEVELESGELDIVYSLSDSDAKQCALIAVEEIIHVIDWHEFETPNEELNYWNKVKQEILKL
jgi:hypothetical protein